MKPFYYFLNKLKTEIINPILLAEKYNTQKANLHKKED